MIARRRIALAFTMLAATAGLTACGDKESRVTHADDEGEYIDVGKLQYQVQISRQLNPSNNEDQGYLVGVNQFNKNLAGDQQWFAVFINVVNSKKNAAPSASQFVMTDTRENKYTPVVLSGQNVFAYHAATVPAKGGLINGSIPAPNSPASEGPTQGALLLFKIPETSLANRPLELSIRDPQSNETGTIDLDV